MKSVYLFVAFFVILSYSFNYSETKIYTSPKNQVQDFKRYFHYINLANRQIYSGNTATAELNLDSAFKQVKIPFLIDLKKKILINWKFKRYNENIGIINFLIKQKHLNKEQLNLLFNKDIVAYYKPSFVSTILNPQNTALKKELELIFKEQQDRLAPIELKQKKDKNNKAKSNAIVNKKRQEFYQLYQAKQFVDMVKKYGFPSENQIGYFIEKKTQDREEKYTSLNSVLDGLIIDFLNTKYRNELCQLLDKALAENKIHPAVYAHIMDRSHGRLEVEDYEFFYVVPAIIEVMGTYYKPFIEYNKDLMAKLNANRVRIGLDSLHIEQYQMASTRICNDSLYKNLIPIPGYSFIDQYGLGVVMYGFNNDKEKLKEYRIDMDKVRMQCNCKEMSY